MNPSLKHLQQLIADGLARTEYGKQPVELYEPIRYMMALGGKRLRPLLVLLGYQLWKADAQKAVDPALAVEVFHNFTLLHDDIMDRAPLRRGKPTVYTQWNENIAILSGDVMLVRAYDLLLDIEAQLLPQVMRRFNATAAEVCEGQQYDMNFETEEEVSEVDYLEMIRLKTAVLLGYSLELGGTLAGAPEEACRQLYRIGESMGIGFQLMDDLLDVYADQAKFGKQVGGDILCNKKTFLLINARKKASGATSEKLEGWLQQTDYQDAEKVAAVTGIYNELGIRELTEARMEQYFAEAYRLLDELKVERTDARQELRSFIDYLIHREK